MSLKRVCLSLILLASTATGCTRNESYMNFFAENYVKLVLAVGQHDAGYVDAYYGPEAWMDEAEALQKPLDVIAEEADALIMALEGIRTSGRSEMWMLRHQYLLRQLQALTARVAMLQGTPFRFDEESKALYDAVAPTCALYRHGSQLRDQR